MSFRTPRLIPEKADFRPALACVLLPGVNGTHMTKMTYGEQLKHPFWQRKRLEILQRANFACECCFETESTLHVHHKRYVKGRMAWEYEAHELAALCEACHDEAHQASALIADILAYADVDGPDGPGDAVGLLFGRYAHLIPEGGELAERVDATTGGWHGKAVAIGSFAAQLARGNGFLLSFTELECLGDVINGPLLPKLRALIQESQSGASGAEPPASSGL